MTVNRVLLVLALLCFVLAIFQASLNLPIELVALGLALWVASALFPPATP